MIVCIISTIFSKKLSRESIYTLKLVQRRIPVQEGPEDNILGSILVKDIYKTGMKPLTTKTPLDEMVSRLVAGPYSALAVLDSDGRLQGTVTMDDVRNYLLDGDTTQPSPTAADIIRSGGPVARPDDNCQDILGIMADSKVEGLPVVDPREPQKLDGMIWRKDILDTYSREIRHRDLTVGLVSRIFKQNSNNEVHFLEGYAITEIQAPPMFIGKSIKELAIRRKYGVEVLLIRSNTPQGTRIKAVPEADYVIIAGDSLVLAGEIGKINLLKSKL